MNAFIQKHRSVVTGQLVGLDRLVLRGSLGAASYLDGMKACMGVEGVLLKEFGDFAREKTDALVSATERFVAERGRKIVYLDSPNVVKEEVALSIARQDRVDRGLICVLKTVEPCVSFDVKGNRAEKRLELVMRHRKGAAFYHYVIHPEWGFSYARIQTWLPFGVQVYLNGREWLARRLDRSGVRYDRADNTFTAVADVEQAQRLLDEQFATDWKGMLEPIARLVNPLYPKVFKRFEVSYAWSVHQSEVATDVMFKSNVDLRQVYRGLVMQGIASFGCGDVLRFLGHRNRTKLDGAVRASFSGEATSDLKLRPEGLRLKHSANANSVKVYDKEGSVLRVETTVNNPRDFKVDRPGEGLTIPRQRLRKGIDDLPRLAAISKATNERYLDALASLSGTTPLGELTAGIGQRATLNGQRVRPLNPHSSADAAILRAVSRGEFVLNGFRNRDICQVVHAEPNDSIELRRQRANVTRRLRILRAHGLIDRLPRTHRYQLTASGRVVVTAVLAALNADATRLTQAA